LGLAYCYTNRPHRALASAQQIIELEPDNLKAYYLLGIVNASMGDFEKARRAWERALAINPGDSLATQNLKELETHMEK
jgi:Flp pilus assembly protein TadD